MNRFIISLGRYVKIPGSSSVCVSYLLQWDAKSSWNKKLDFLPLVCPFALIVKHDLKILELWKINRFMIWISYIFLLPTVPTYPMVTRTKKLLPITLISIPKICLLFSFLATKDHWVTIREGSTVQGFNGRTLAVSRPNLLKEGHTILQLLSGAWSCFFSQMSARALGRCGRTPGGSYRTPNQGGRGGW